MIGHLSFGVADLERAKRFYDTALSALGYARVWTSEHGVGYGGEGSNDKLALLQRENSGPPGAGFHLALIANSPEAVDGFYAAAVEAGGTCNGPPGLRPHYGPTYYAAFVVDPDGYKLEAVYQ